MPHKFFPFYKPYRLDEIDTESMEKEPNSRIIEEKKPFKRIKIALFLVILILFGITASSSIKFKRLFKKHKKPKVPELPLTEAQCAEERLYFEQLVDSIQVHNIAEAPDRIEEWNVKNFVNQNFQYENRFSPYTNINNKTYTRYIECNKYLTIEDRSAIYIQIRGTRKMTPDFLTSLRALFIEAGWKQKVDAYVLVQVDDIEDFDEDDFPEELHSILIPVTPDDVSTDFVKRVKNKEIGKEGKIIRDANYLVDIWFSNKFPQYEYIWVTEDDVRSIAPWSSLMKDTINTCNKKTAESHLILFAPIWKVDNTDKVKNWRWGLDLIPQEHSYKAFTNLRRLSKTLIQAMQNATLNHQFANLEHFIPSMASQYDLDVCVYVQPTFYKDTDRDVLTPHVDHNRFHYANLPPLDENHSYPTLGCYHCCNGYNTDMWIEWQKKTIDYLPMMVVHPVKIYT